MIANRFTHGVLHRWYSNKAMGYAYYTVWPTVTETPRPKFIASVAPTKAAEERAYFYTPPTHYGRGCGASIAGETLHNRETAMCGMCGHSFARHSDNCEREESSEFGDYVHDYYQYGPIVMGRNPRTYIVPYEDYAGYPEDEESEEFYRDSEWEEEFQAEGGYERQDFYWQDGRPNECTEVLVDVQFTSNSVKGTAVNGLHGFPLPEGMYVDTRAIEAASKTVYVEGITGYHSIKLLDLLITAKSHAKMLNCYRKDGILRIGGLSLFPKQEHEDPEFGDLIWTEVTARCGHHNCRYQDARRNWKQQEFTLAGYELTREQMEDFVYSLIRHGNNHAAPWFHDRVMAKAVHNTVEHSTWKRVGSKFIADREVFSTPKGPVEVLWQEVGVYEREPVRTATSKSPWRVIVPKDTPTFYKVHERTCNLACDPTSVVC